MLKRFEPFEHPCQRTCQFFSLCFMYSSNLSSSSCFCFSDGSIVFESNCWVLFFRCIESICFEQSVVSFLIKILNFQTSVCYVSSFKLTSEWVNLNLTSLVDLNKRLIDELVLVHLITREREKMMMRRKKKEKKMMNSVGITQCKKWRWWRWWQLKEWLATHYKHEHSIIH